MSCSKTGKFLVLHFLHFFTRCPFLLIFMELHIPLVRFFLHLIREKTKNWHFQINNTLLNIHTSVPSRVSLIRLKRFRLRTSKPSAIYPVKWFWKTPCSDFAIACYFSNQFSETKFCITLKWLLLLFSAADMFSWDDFLKNLSTSLSEKASTVVQKGNTYFCLMVQ